MLGWRPCPLSRATTPCSILRVCQLRCSRWVPISPMPLGKDTLNEIVDADDGQWMRPFFVPPDLNLAHPEVRTRIARGISNNITTSGSCSDISTQLVQVAPMFDGDPNTAAFFNVSTSENSGIQTRLYVQNSIVELGVNYPINRIRFYPTAGHGQSQNRRVARGDGRAAPNEVRLGRGGFHRELPAVVRGVGGQQLQQLCFPLLFEHCREPLVHSDKQPPRGSSQTTRG